MTAAASPEGASEEYESASDLSTANTTEALADGVAEDCAENRKELNHGGDVGLFVGLGRDAKVLFEGLLGDHTADETLVDTTRGTRRPMPTTARARRQLSADLGVSEKWANLEGMYMVTSSGAEEAKV